MPSDSRHINNRTIFPSTHNDSTYRIGYAGVQRWRWGKSLSARLYIAVRCVYFENEKYLYFEENVCHRLYRVRSIIYIRNDRIGWSSENFVKLADFGALMRIRYWIEMRYMGPMNYSKQCLTDRQTDIKIHMWWRMNEHIMNGVHGVRQWEILQKWENWWWWILLSIVDNRMETIDSNCIVFNVLVLEIIFNGFR